MLSVVNLRSIMRSARQCDDIQFIETFHIIRVANIPMELHIMIFVI